MQSNNVNFVGFNQDYECILMGNSGGYSMYSIENDIVCEKENNKVTPIMKLGRLFNSSLVVYVSTEDPRKLTLFHHKRNAVIIELKFSNSILSVKLNRKVVVICTEDGIYIYDMDGMKRKHKIEIAPSNRNGIFALSANDVSVLAYPPTTMTGNIHVFNIAEMKNVAILEAHQGAIAALEFNQPSDCLATASDKGTVIRLFKIPSGDKVGEFRRGFARCATISCLSFSIDSQFLLVSSNTETIHIFNLLQMSTSPEKDSKYSSQSSVKEEQQHHQHKFSSMSSNDVGASATKWFNYVGTALKATTSFLPYPAQQVSDMFSQDRCFSVARLPGTDNSPAQFRHSQRKVGAVVEFPCGWRVIVATFDGFIYVFKFDAENGGEAELLSTYDLVNGKHIIKNVRTPSGDSSAEPNQQLTTRTRSKSLHEQTVTGVPNSELNITDENEFPPIQR